MADVPGPVEERARKLHALHEEVKRVAILMCEEMLLDPFKVSQSGTHRPMMAWEHVYDEARKALVGWRAVNKYIMTET